LQPGLPQMQPLFGFISPELQLPPGVQSQQFPTQYPPQMPFTPMSQQQFQQQQF